MICCNAKYAAICGVFFSSLDSTTEVIIYDISDPSDPQTVGHYQHPPEPWPSFSCRHTAVSGGLAFLSEGNYGTRIVDVSDPRNPVELELIDTPGWASHVTPAGHHLFVSQRETGVSIYFNHLILKNGFEFGDTSAWTVAP